MDSPEVLSSYIKKLSHPIKEIRERSLQLLIAKMRLGWELEDELAGTRELLEALLAWFHVQQPTLQRQALQLLLFTIKTKSGTYIAKEFGVKRILSTLKRARSKIDLEAADLFEEVLETIEFLSTVESDVNINIPPLKLGSLTSSASDGESSSGCYDLGANCLSSTNTSVSGEDNHVLKQRSKPTDGILIFLFPWVELCSSDSKTMLLVEDALKLLKSTRRCCRFIRDVFLRDFPPEIFLNRPAIIKSLLTISDGERGGRPGEALCVLLSVTNALRQRILQLTSLDLIHKTNLESKSLHEGKDSEDDINSELEQFCSGLPDQREDQGLAALNQLPAPLFCLDTLQAVLSTMARSIVVLDTRDNFEVLNLKEHNTCLCLVESLVLLLLDCVRENFWSVSHSTKTHKDIAHKSCMVMRLLGDLITNFRKSFLDNPDKTHHRVAWIRLVSHAEKLLYWAKDSALPPSVLIVALQTAQIDPGLDLLYPKLCIKIGDILQLTKSSGDQEFRTKYKELTKLTSNMNASAKLIKNKSLRLSNKVLSCIKDSLPALEIHNSEEFLNDIADILLVKCKEMDFTENDWCMARSICLSLMAHNVAWVRAKFYMLLMEMVKGVLESEDSNQRHNEKCLTLLCDVSVLTEICCHGLCSSEKQISSSATDIMLYLLRGRMILSESCWWRLLASLLPVLPLLHVYAEHDTAIGKAICKSLESDIAECMGVSTMHTVWGVARLMFVACSRVRLHAYHCLCRAMDDERYLPPRESLRADVLINALNRVKPQEFNVDYSISPSKSSPRTGLTQILDVLKQDIVVDEHGTEFTARASLQSTLDPSLRRSTLQQLSVIMRQPELHDTFIQCDGVKIVVATLRMSLMVDDYLAFPECAISCVSILNSVCFATRHTLSQICDLPLLLARVILVFPANESAVTLCAQTLALLSWSGFVLQELDSNKHRVPALPANVVDRTVMPFPVNKYWQTSANAEHSATEWLLSDSAFRAALRVRWLCALQGSRALLISRGEGESPIYPTTPSLRVTASDLLLLRSACPLYCSTKALLALENATSHKQVCDALCGLESYAHLLPLSSTSGADFSSLPWQHLQRFLNAPPASVRDTSLLTTLLQFVLAYMDYVTGDGDTTSWIRSSFIGNEASVLSLLSRDQLLPQQNTHESIEVTHLNIHIVKVILKCVKIVEKTRDYDSRRMESLLKILLSCLERVDLKNFHMLGYLNELLCCIRYVINSRYCLLSEDTSLQALGQLAISLAGFASGGGRKGQACRLDALVSLLALLRHVYEEAIPVQRWSDVFTSQVVQTIVTSCDSERVELRAVSIHVMSALAQYTQLLPHLLQAIPGESLAEFAVSIFIRDEEANLVREAATQLLTAVTSRVTAHCQVYETEILEQLKEKNFLEYCLEVLVDFCNHKEYKKCIEPNVPLSMLERRNELEVRSRKCGDIYVSPNVNYSRVPPTAGLVVGVANVLHNVSGFKECPVQLWNDQGLYRLLFRCTFWVGENATESHRCREATSRSLVAVVSRKCVRTTLAATKDCLHGLMMTMTSFDQDEIDVHCLRSRSQALTLLAGLLGERAASDVVWTILMEENATTFFVLLLQCLETDETELQDSALYCLAQLAQSSIKKKHPDKTSNYSRVQFLDSVKSPFYKQAEVIDWSGDSVKNDCQPEFIVEELTKVLIILYQKLSVEKRFLGCQDDRWNAVCSCLSSVFSISPRSRTYAVHRQMPRILLGTLQIIRDKLSLQEQPVQVIRNANSNPTLHALYWILTALSCLIIDNLSAKEDLCSDNLCATLVKLWPWCMMTQSNREAVTLLLYNLTSNCQKAWHAMSVCVGGRSLVVELCALCSSEAALVPRARSSPVLPRALRSLRRTVPHHAARAAVLQSDVLSCMYKLRLQERYHGNKPSGAAWAALCEALARHADGAAAILNLKPLLTSPGIRARLMPAIAHTAHHCRNTFLLKPDLLDLLTGTLLAGDMDEVVSAARAVWALAANNHKAKLQLRSAGVTSAVRSALQRLQRTEFSERVVQLLTYTNTVLQTS